MFNIDTHLISPSVLWPDVTVVNNDYRDSKSTGLCAPGSVDGCSTIDLVLFGLTKSPLSEVQETSEYAQPPPHIPKAVHWWT